MTDKSPQPPITGELMERLARVRLLALDVDGTLTDGGLYYGHPSVELKRFDVQDGLGIVLARGVGLETAIITGRRSELVAWRARELGISTVLQGVRDKGQAMLDLAKTSGLELSELAFMGDDLNDLPAMARVGVALAPASAVSHVREAADWVATQSGGAGAVREAIELILKAGGDYEVAVRLYLEKLSPGQ